MASSRAKWAVAAVLSVVVAVLGWIRFHRTPEGASAASTASARQTRSPRPRVPDLRQQPRSMLSGRVAEPGGAPLPGASVCARVSSSRLSSAETRKPLCATTDASGRYELGDLLPARYSLAASAPRHRPRDYRGPAPERRAFVDTEPGRSATVDFTLEPGGVEVRGHVRDLSGGVIHGAFVLVTGGGQRADAIARTDAAGAFSAWVEGGTVYAHASADGYGDGWKEGQAPGVDLEILLTPESVLVGRVVEAGGGEPVPGAKIALEGEWGGYGRLGSADAIADDEGRFTVRKLAPGRYKATATAPGRYGQAKESVLLGLGETSKEVVVEVHPAFDVAGKVTVLPEGGPCVEGSVELSDRAHKRVRTAPCERDGSARFEGVLPGSYDVRVSCSDRVPEPKYPPVVVASADVTGVAWTVRAGIELAGRLVDRDDKPVLGFVRSAPKNADPRAQRVQASARVEPDGSFVLKGLLAGKHTLTARPTDRPWPEPLEVELHEGKNPDVKIVVENSGSVEGTVADEEAHPVAGAEVSVSGSKYNSNGTRTQADGSFLLEGLAPGAYRVLAQSEGASLRQPGKGDDDPQGVAVTIKAGATARVKLVVESRSGEIRGQVADGQGGPVTDAFLDAEREPETASAAPGAAIRRVRWGSWSRSPALTDTEGKFAIGGLQKGLYTVRAYRKGGGEAFAEHARPGESVTVTFKSTGSIAGTVRLAGGAPPDQLTVRVADRPRGFSRTESFFRTGGAWTMNDLPAGSFEISADAPEGTVTVEAPLAEGEQKTGVLLSLSGRVTLQGQAVSLDGTTPVPGLRVIVSSRKGLGPSFQGEDPDRQNITDASGRFTIERAPSGPVTIILMPLDWQTSDYGYAQVPAEVGDGPVFDVGPLLVPRRRTAAAMDRGGDLGFTLQAQVPGTDPAQATFTVAVVRPEGPASAAGLVAGDVIVSVDGKDVTGKQGYLYYGLTRVPEGTTVALGLSRGAVVSIAAGKQP